MGAFDTALVIVFIVLGVAGLVAMVTIDMSAGMIGFACLLAALVIWSMGSLTAEAATVKSAQISVVGHSAVVSWVVGGGNAPTSWRVKDGKSTCRPSAVGSGYGAIVGCTLDGISVPSKVYITSRAGQRTKSSTWWGWAVRG